MGSPVKVLVTGARGQLGHDLVSVCEAAGDEVVACSSSDLDLADRDSVLSAITSVAPDVVVSAGAWTAVDACESDPDKAWRVNALGPGSAPDSAEPADAAPASGDGPARLTHDFRTGVPDLSRFPRAAWARATRAALAAMPDAELGYLPPAGLERVRVAVAEYLGRVRGVSCTPDQVVLGNGFGHIAVAVPDAYKACEAVAAEGGSAPIERIEGSGDAGLSSFAGQELTKSMEATLGATLSTQPGVAERSFGARLA